MSKIEIKFKKYNFGGIRNSTVVYERMRFFLRYIQQHAYAITAGFYCSTKETIFKKVCYIANKFRLYDKHGNSEYKTSLRDLIQADPKVFYTGILRHCSIKPIPFKKFDLHEKNSDTQVLYPKDNPVLYRAPLGYFVSLKINKVKPSSGTAIYPIFPCCIKSEERRKNNIYQIYKECSSDHEFKRKIELMLVRVLSTTIVNIDYVSSIYTPLNSVWSASEYLRIRVVDWFEEFSCERFNENLNDEDKQILYRNTKDLGFIDVPLYWNMYKNLDMI